MAISYCQPCTPSATPSYGPSYGNKYNSYGSNNQYYGSKDYNYNYSVGSSASNSGSSRDSGSNSGSNGSNSSNEKFEPAFPGAKFDKSGYCLKHPMIKLCKPAPTPYLISDKNGPDNRSLQRRNFSDTSSEEDANMNNSGKPQVQVKYIIIRKTCHMCGEHGLRNERKLSQPGRSHGYKEPKMMERQNQEMFRARVEHDSRTLMRRGSMCSRSMGSATHSNYNGGHNDDYNGANGRYGGHCAPPPPASPVSSSYVITPSSSLVSPVTPGMDPEITTPTSSSSSSSRCRRQIRSDAVKDIMGLYLPLTGQTNKNDASNAMNASPASLYSDPRDAGRENHQVQQTQANEQSQQRRGRSKNSRRPSLSRRGSSVSNRTRDESLQSNRTRDESLQSNRTRDESLQSNRTRDESLQSNRSSQTERSSATAVTNATSSTAASNASSRTRRAKAAAPVPPPPPPRPAAFPSGGSPSINSSGSNGHREGPPTMASSSCCSVSVTPSAQTARAGNRRRGEDPVPVSNSGFNLNSSFNNSSKSICFTDLPSGGNGGNGGFNASFGGGLNHHGLSHNSNIHDSFSASFSGGLNHHQPSHSQNGGLDRNHHVSFDNSVNNNGCNFNNNSSGLRRRSSRGSIADNKIDSKLDNESSGTTTSNTTGGGGNNLPSRPSFERRVSSGTAGSSSGFERRSSTGVSNLTNAPTNASSNVPSNGLERSTARMERRGSSKFGRRHSSCERNKSSTSGSNIKSSSGDVNSSSTEGKDTNNNTRSKSNRLIGQDLTRRSSAGPDPRRKIQSETSGRLSQSCQDFSYSPTTSNQLNSSPRNLRSSNESKTLDHSSLRSLSNQPKMMEPEEIKQPRGDPLPLRGSLQRGRSIGSVGNKALRTSTTSDNKNGRRRNRSRSSSLVKKQDSTRSHASSTSSTKSPHQENKGNNDGATSEPSQSTEQSQQTHQEADQAPQPPQQQQQKQLPHQRQMREQPVQPATRGRSMFSCNLQRSSSKASLLSLRIHTHKDTDSKNNGSSNNTCNNSHSSHNTSASATNTESASRSFSLKRRGSLSNISKRVLNTTSTMDGNHDEEPSSLMCTMRYEVPFNPMTGMCNVHPNVCLAVKEKRGGWKIVRGECPRCVHSY